LLTDVDDLPEGKNVKRHMRCDNSGSGPIHREADEGSTRSSMGVSRLPWFSLKGIGLLLLAVVVLPWLPKFARLSDQAPGRRVQGFGDSAILSFAFAPDGRTIATIQTDGRLTLRDVASDGRARSVLEHSGHAIGLAFSPDGRSLAVGDLGRDV